MKVVIIEDERLTADDLAETILKIEPNAQIIAKLYSVREAILYLSKNEKQDLIFSDIQLGDGTAFEIFKAVSVLTPVIFCTAYDEYALNAFKANGIDYILKPFTKGIIVDAFTRYRELKDNFVKSIPSYEIISEIFENRSNRRDSSILVYIKDKILPIKINDIALFYVKNQITHFITFNQRTHTVDKTLEEVETITNANFYRANRQYLINRKAIRDASQYFHRKLAVNLSIPFDERITVSKVKVTDFLNWLSDN